VMYDSAMTPAQQRIEAMVREGVVTSAEGASMLEALRARGRWAAILDPLAWRFASLPAALVVAVAAIVLGTAGVRFDGALDLHLPGAPVRLVSAVRDTVVATLCLILALQAASRVLARRGRTRDFVVAVGLARIPLLVTGALLLALSPPPDEILRRATENPADPLLLLVAVASVPGLVLYLALLYQGFRSASGLLGARLVIAFISALVVAEVASKLLVG
jgi:hypothetical protein